MPIKIPNDLPAAAVLKQERVAIIRETDALHQDIRPLQVAILNLMPDKIKTETQLLRVLGATPLQIEITLLHAGSHTSKNTSADHLSAFYQTHADVRDRKFDALIVTGAPIEHIPYEEVTYWRELTAVFDWAKTHVYSCFFICWGAQAALFHYHRVPKHPLPDKHSGIFPHRIIKPFEPLVTGFDDFFNVPVSRHTEIRNEDIARVPGLEILVESEKTGVCLVEETKKRRFYMFNHLEYDAGTIGKEFERDRAAGMEPSIPFNYFPGDDPKAPPRMTWRAHRNLLFSNWINLVYQGTPYNLDDLETID